MKKIILLFLFINSILNAKVNTIVSVAPQVAFLKAIGGDKVNITLMVKPGNSPHTYEPKPSQMKDITKANVYFSIGVEFEDAWLSRFQNQNKNMKIVDISEGIKKTDMQAHSYDQHDKYDEHGNKDPHIWTNPDNVKVIAQNIYKALIKIDKSNKKYYKDNLKKFLLYVDNIDNEIKTLLNGKKIKFIVFHPSWGYFAKKYNLVQIPIQVEGKSPKPKELKYLIQEAKKEKVNAIFTSPEFSDAIAKQIANELHISVIKISPLAKNWGQNLVKFTKAIVNEN